MAAIADLEEAKMYSDVCLVFVKKFVNKRTLRIPIVKSGMAAEGEKMGIVTSERVRRMECIAGVNNELIILPVFSQTRKT
jgi:hypothetical protein